MLLPPILNTRTNIGLQKHKTQIAQNPNKAQRPKTQSKNVCVFNSLHFVFYLGSGFCVLGFNLCSYRGIRIINIGGKLFIEYMKQCPQKLFESPGRREFQSIDFHFQNSQ